MPFYSTATAGILRYRPHRYNRTKSEATMPELDEGVFAKLIAALKRAAESGYWSMERQGQHCTMKVGIRDKDRVILDHGVLTAMSPKAEKMLLKASVDVQRPVLTRGRLTYTSLRTGRSVLISEGAVSALSEHQLHETKSGELHISSHPTADELTRVGLIAYMSGVTYITHEGKAATHFFRELSRH